MSKWSDMTAKERQAEREAAQAGREMTRILAGRRKPPDELIIKEVGRRWKNWKA